MTTVTAISTPFAVLAAALSERRPIRISYHGKERLVSPHALGWKAGRSLLLAYQNGNQAPSGSGWRNFFVDEIAVVTPTDGERWQSSAGYNPDRPFSSIDDVAFAVG